MRDSTVPPAGISSPTSCTWPGDDQAPRGSIRCVRRRAVQAGYPRDAVRPHLFRHTRAHQHLADGGAEGDLMQTMGWSDRSMIDRYGASLAQSRALADAHRRGLDDRY